MRAGYTHVGLILDASGSMWRIQDEIKDTLREFARRQLAEKEPDEMIVLDAWQFASEVRHIIRDAPIGAYNPDLYRCGGATALYDAICEGVDSLKRRFARLPEEERPEDVLIAIVTDGVENASRRFDLSDARRRIETQSKRGDWKFMFLASNIDVDRTGEDLGIADAEDRVELREENFAKDMGERMHERVRYRRAERAARRRRNQDD